MVQIMTKKKKVARSINRLYKSWLYKEDGSTFSNRPSGCAMQTLAKWTVQLIPNRRSEVVGSNEFQRNL
jgi:hypothetical protein